MTKTWRHIPIRLVAFDADDTLWDNQNYYKQTEYAYCKLLADYGTPQEISDALLQVETANMPLLGFGCKAFTISMIENAVACSKGNLSAEHISEIIRMGKALLEHPVTPLPHVKQTLERLKIQHKYKLVIFTKGETLDQQNKVIRSGLSSLFDDVVIAADKTRQEYLRLCDMFDTDISQMVMVGNSFKSDIEPVLQLGGYAIHIPFHTTWQLEETREYEHPHLIQLVSFDSITQIL